MVNRPKNEGQQVIHNIDLMIAARELCKQIMADKGLNLEIFEVVYPSENLPGEFLFVKPIIQSNDGSPTSDGTVEICIYVENNRKADDQSQPNKHRLKELTDIFIPRFRNASKNKIAFNDFRMDIVRDSNIRYFYQSIVINTKSINV